MSLVSRIKNIWYWSNIPAPKDKYFRDEDGATKIANSVNLMRGAPPSKEVFISREPRDPVKEITTETA